jgi:hypothetical protein
LTLLADRLGVLAGRAQRPYWACWPPELTLATPEQSLA